MLKNLVIYYSRKGENWVNGSVRSLVKGNTEICAEFIRNEVWADMFEIETEKEYPTEYKECTKTAKKELENGERPELKRYLDDISKYENVFICAPNWWGTLPAAVFTQLERLDFTGLRVMLLVTHEGSGIANAEKDIRKACRGAAFGEPLAVQGSFVAERQREVRTWAAEQIK